MDKDSELVAGEIMKHMNRRIEVAVDRKLGDVGRELTTMGAPGNGSDVLHRLKRLAEMHADDKAVVKQASLVHDLLDKEGVKDAVDVGDGLMRALTLEERVLSLVKNKGAPPFTLKLNDGVVRDAIRDAIAARMDADGVKRFPIPGTQCEVRVRDPEGVEAVFFGEHVDVENYVGGTRLDIKRDVLRI